MIISSTFTADPFDPQQMIWTTYIDLLSLLLEEEPSAPDTANTFGKFNLVINVTQPVCPPLNTESRQENLKPAKERDVKRDDSQRQFLAQHRRSYSVATF